MITYTLNDEVLFASEHVRTFSASDVEWLRQKAQASPHGKMRICLHRTSDDTMHEMLVALRRDVVYPPHRCNLSEETHFIVEGAALLHIYYNDGTLKESFSMGTVTSGKISYVRIPAGTYHSFTVLSEVCVYLETKLGPFSEQKNEIADFAPKNFEMRDI